MRRSASINPLLDFDQVLHLPTDAAAFSSHGLDGTESNDGSAESQLPPPAELRGIVENSAIYLKFYPHHFEDFSARPKSIYIEEGEDSLGVSGPHTTHLNIAQLIRLCERRRTLLFCKVDSFFKGKYRPLSNHLPAAFQVPSTDQMGVQIEPSFVPASSRTPALSPNPLSSMKTNIT